MAFRHIFLTSFFCSIARIIAGPGKYFLNFLDDKEVNSVYTILVMVIPVVINNEGAFRFSKG